jgi:hypothetical protein
VRLEPESEGSAETDGRARMVGTAVARVGGGAIDVVSGGAAVFEGSVVGVGSGISGAAGVGAGLWVR